MWNTLAGNLGKVTVAAAIVALAGCHCNKDTDQTPPPAQPAARETVPAGPQASVQPVAGTGKVINTMCPIGGDDFGTEPHPATLTREHHGKAIGFCCNHCVVKFDKMTQAQRDGVLKLAEANAAPTE